MKQNTSPIATASYLDALAPAGVVSYYKITAVDSNGECEAANLSASNIPAAPNGLVATPLSTTSIRLNWYGTVGTTLYHIEREVVGGNGFVEIGTSTTPVYYDAGLTSSTNYVYQVRAQNTAGYSNYSIVAQATTSTGVAPGVPTGLAAQLNAAGQVVLAWTAPTGTVTAYHVEREGPGQTTFTEIAGNVATPSFTDTTAQPSTTYLYRVRAENAGTLGGYTTPNVQISTGTVAVPSAPVTVTATANSSSQITVNWTAVSGAASYVIQNQVTGSGTWTTLATAWSAGTAFVDTNAEPGTSYTYQVAAQNTSGTSAYTQGQAATPAGLYQSADIAATPAGSTVTNIEGSSYDISAYGLDIGGSTPTDSFRFEYQQLTGNFDAVVQVQSLLNTFSTAKAGLMVRTSLDPGSPMVFNGATAASSFRWLYRTAANSLPVFSSVGSNVSYPNVWVRLTRIGNVFSGYSSADGLTWVPTGTLTLALPPTVYFGMGLSSHNTSLETTAQFRALSILLPPAAPVASATANSSNTISLNWNYVATASSYSVLRFNPATSTYASIATGLATNSYTDINLTANTAYQYEVVAVNSVGSSPVSNVASATTTTLATSASVGSHRPGRNVAIIR